MWMKSALKTKKAFSIFWATTQRRNCRNVHGIEVAKMKLSTELLETYKWLKFDPPKGMLCLLCQKSKKQNPFTVGCANYRTSTLVHNTRYIRIKKYKVKKIVTPPPPKKKTKCPSKNNWLEHIAPLAGNPRSTLCRAYNFKKNLQTCFTLLSALSSALVFCGSSPVASAPPTASGLSSFFPSSGGAAFCWGNVDCGFCFCFLLLCLCLDPLPFSGWAY